MGKQALWRTYSVDFIKEVVSNSYSDREVATKLGYSNQGGGTMQTLHKMYKELNLDTSHFKGQGWRKEDYDYDSFKTGSYKKRGATTLTPLIALRGRKCECCGLTEWMGQEINLQIHHIDGNHLNNELDNLQLLCPNCHSYTENYCKKNKKPTVPEDLFVQALKDNKSIRQALIKLNLSPAGANYERARELIEKYNIEHLI